MKIKIKVMVQVVMGLALLRPFTLEAQKPNIVYILTDQWRASAFGYAGDPNVQTPNIDQLAKEFVAAKKEKLNFISKLYLFLHKYFVE